MRRLIAPELNLSSFRLRFPARAISRYRWRATFRDNGRFWRDLKADYVHGRIIHG